MSRKQGSCDFCRYLRHFGASASVSHPLEALFSSPFGPQKTPRDRTLRSKTAVLGIENDELRERCTALRAAQKGFSVIFVRNTHTGKTGGARKDRKNAWMQALRPQVP